MRWYYWVVAVVIGSWIVTILYEGKVKEEAFNYALTLQGYKGIANFGATGSGVRWACRKIAQSPAIKVNVDIKADDTPKFLHHNLEQMPYPFGDKEFNVAFCSHILEHLENWEGALNEWRRIADNVVLVLPYPYLHGWLSPDHKQHFTAGDVEKMRQTLGIHVFY